jgi:MFS family permease
MRPVLARPHGRLRRLDPALVAASLALVLYWAALYVYVPILPLYARALGASLSLVGLIVASYGFSQLLLRVPIGLAADRLGRRRPFALAGLATAALSNLVLALAPTAGWLLVGRGLAGVSAATWVVLSVLFAGYFPASATTRAMGTASFLSGLAQLVATTAGGKLAAVGGWTTPFLVGVALGGLGTLVLALTPERPPASAPTTPSWRALLRAGGQPALLLLATIAALGQYSFWAASYAFVPVYAAGLGLGPAEVGLLTTAMLLAYTLAALALVPLARHASDRQIVSGGLVLAALSPLLTPLISDFGLLLVVQAVGGLGRGLAFPSLMGACLRVVGPHERATAMGVYQAVYAAGMTLGPATAGVIAESLGVSGALWVSGGLTLVGLLLTGPAFRATDPV